jgi:hypothetical protein
MAIMEIARAAEHDVKLCRATFKTNSPATKPVLDQLLRVIENGHPELQVPCLTAMGSLACIFPAAARVIPPITEALASRDVAVAAEASHTLYKFANKENYLHVDHSNNFGVEWDFAFGGFVKLLECGHSNIGTQSPLLFVHKCSRE